MIQYPRYRQHRFSSFQVIIAGFAAVDLVGALLLMLPIAAQQRCVTPFHEALFTSTSALCVTGLVVQDTGSYWSAFGQSVILLLIQIGGLGVITVGAAFALLSGRKISLKQRSTMQEATAAPQMGGIVRLTGFILRITALFELVGAALLLPTFCADYGLRGIWYALFHSISAFCNAGFDLLGTEGAKFVSLTQYAGDPLLTTVIAALIVFGGLGFLTWEDICTYRLDFHRYRMQSKVILVTTAFLLVLPSLYFYCFEFTAGSARQRILLSMFQSVTPRTAGFNTADLAAMGSTSQALMVVLMLLGGSPGSTAGGMKTTTFAVLLANMWATFRRREDAEFFGRRIDSSAVKNAATIGGSDIGYHAAIGHPFAGGADRTDVFGTCWRIDVDLCGIWQQPCPLSSAAGEDCNRIKETTMKSILLIGLGRFGRHIAQELNELGHQVMAIDSNEDRVNAVLSYVTNAQIGDSTSEYFLRSLGVGNFDVCIVTIGGNFQNSLETTSLLKELGAKLVVSRAERDVQAKFLLRNGADEVVYPEKQLAKWAAIRYSSEHILDYIELQDDHAIMEVTIPPEWMDRTIGEINIRKKYNINILALKKDGKLDMNITPDTQLCRDESMLVLGKYASIQKCFRL